MGAQGTVFCSENCFLFWRRASFKRAKTCDFCKSVRNAVSYVDFNDGASQLQFCSDKCLNQYKMQIFCRETQAHLELNPHLKEKKEAGGKLRQFRIFFENKLRNFDILLLDGWEKLLASWFPYQQAFLCRRWQRFSMLIYIQLRGRPSPRSHLS